MRDDKIYYVSEDIESLLNGSGIPENHFANQNIIVPNHSFIKGIRENFQDSLSSIFSNVKIISEEEMKNAMNSLVEHSQYPVVSLDRVYLSRHPKVVDFLDVTRISNDGELKLTLRLNQHMCKSVEQGISILSNRIKTRTKRRTPEIALADDVIFSGDGIIDLAKMFYKNGVIVKQALAGICVKDTSEKLKTGGKISVKSGFVIDNVHDQICERDFYFGIPHSGMMIQDKRGNLLKCPYFLPFGEPGRRASIPSQNEVPFSISCINRSLSLWKKIEDLSHRKIGLHELPERISKAEGTSVVAALEKAKKQLQRC